MDREGADPETSPRSGINTRKLDRNLQLPTWTSRTASGEKTDGQGTRSYQESNLCQCVAAVATM